MTTQEAQNSGLSDIEQLEFATLKGRSIFTFNIPDFSQIHTEFICKGLRHKGIILSKQLPMGVIISGLIKIILSKTPEEMENNIVWLSNFL